MVKAGAIRIACCEKRKHFWSFKRSKQFVRKLRLRNGEDWHRYCKNNKKPYQVPIGVKKIYEAEWMGWKDFLGVKCN
jgi:hypothetical protein